MGLELTPLEEELWKQREAIQPKLPVSEPPLSHEFKNLKGAINVLRGIAGTLSDDIAVELDSNEPSTVRRNEILIAQREIQRLQQTLVEQSKANVALEK